MYLLLVKSQSHIFVGLKDLFARTPTHNFEVGQNLSRVVQFFYPVGKKERLGICPG